MWNVVPIWFLYSSVLMVVRCADLRSAICDLVLGFFGTYSGTLGRSGPCILRYLWWYAGPIWSLYSSILIGIFCTSLTFQDRTPSPLPSPRMFFPVGWKRQPEEGGIGPGCCGGGVITTWAAGDGVIAAGPAVWAEGEFCTWRSLWSLSQRRPSSDLYLPQKFPDTPDSHPYNHV